MLNPDRSTGSARPTTATRSRAGAAPAAMQRRPPGARASCPAPPGGGRGAPPTAARLAALVRATPAACSRAAARRASAAATGCRCAGPTAASAVLDDPYRFGPVLGELDAWLLAEGTHLRPFEVLGAHAARARRRGRHRFAVWAPNASRVSVVGDFNHVGRPPPPDAPAPRVRRVGDLPARRGAGARYKYELRDATASCCR
jgi:hypothetical protein